MADYKQLFKTTENQNWLKVAVAIHITKTGLSNFVTDAAVKLRDKIINSIQQGTNLPAGTRCFKCNNCPETNCEKFRQMIKTYHRFKSGPSWKNTNQKDWCTNSWEVAKCFFPGDGYRDKVNAQETDFNGIVGFILNSMTFDGQTGENLSNIKGNKFAKCRQFVNLVRHAATLEVKDADLTDYITQLKDLLTSGAVLQNNTTANGAHGQLILLENDNLTITTDDIVKVIEYTLEETKQLISKATEVNKEASNINADTRDLQTKLETLNDVYKHAVEDIEKQKQDAIKVIQDEGNTNVAKVTDQANVECDRIQEAGDKTLQAIKTQGKHTEDEKNYEKKKNALRQALAQHYLKRKSTMPLAPLMPEVDEQLNMFYVPFNMEKVDTKSTTPLALLMSEVDEQLKVDTKSTTKSEKKTQVLNRYKSIFYDGDSSLNNIYIQGEAGIGKTTFCTKLGLVWSENVSKEISRQDYSSKRSTVEPKQDKEQVFSDKTILNEFEFVFSLALRDVANVYEIEDMIETLIISELPDHSKYAGLVPTILDNERCLIILDGLDEWSYQTDLHKTSGLVPHGRSWSKTTVLTLTRPWKMNEVRLKDSEVCVLINITGITDTEAFVGKVLKRLNDKYNKTLDVRDFLTYMEDKKLKHFLDIPVVAMQLLWLRHSGHEFGDSKCKTYMKMLGMLFGRTRKKTPSACDDTGDNREGLPPCFESEEFCEQHKMLLDCLGSLAFHTLHSRKREESLVFSESTLARYVKSTAARKTALTTGILSQHKSPSRVGRRSNLSFLHKTFQEFLAAYHIATCTDAYESEYIVQTMFQVYGQTVDIMDISELFVFVCGLNIEMASQISDSVMKSFSVKLTNHIEELLVSGDFNDVSGMTRSLQEMILAGYKESISNGHQDPQLALHHVHYHSDDDNSDSSDDGKIYRDRLVDTNIDKIVTLSAGGEFGCTVDVEKIQQILAQSSSTLSHVSLLNVKGLTDASLDLFTNITLNSLHLWNINTHFDIKLNTSSLLYCGLWQNSREAEHSVLSALTSASQLHTLDVWDCRNMSVLCQVLPTLPMLHRLGVHDWMIPASLCQVMSTLSQLQRLSASVAIRGRCDDISLLCQAPSTLSNLQYIRLWSRLISCGTDLGDNDILLPNSIQEIVLHYVKLTCRSFRQLVDRLTQIPHKVTCKLKRCIVRPEEEWDAIVWDSDEEEWRLETGEEWDAIVKHIQQSHMFEIHRNDINRDGYIYFHFTKIQT